MSEEFETVDLTSSFYQIDYQNCVMNDTIIEINDSFTHTYSSRKETKKKDSFTSKCSKTKPHERRRTSTPQKVDQESCSKKSNPTFECPICWEEMRDTPLASTKCGHVFCMKCLQKSLKDIKTCPKCRRSLTGKNAYHPVYLF